MDFWLCHGSVVELSAWDISQRRKHHGARLTFHCNTFCTVVIVHPLWTSYTFGGTAHMFCGHSKTDLHHTYSIYIYIYYMPWHVSCSRDTVVGQSSSYDVVYCRVWVWVYVCLCGVCVCQLANSITSFCHAKQGFVWCFDGSFWSSMLLPCWILEYEPFCLALDQRFSW